MNAMGLKAVVVTGVIIIVGAFGGYIAMGEPAEEKVEGSKPLLEGSPIQVSSDVSIYSKYLWRGFKLDDDPVIQPGVYLGAYGLKAGVWGSFDIDGDDLLNSDEMDYMIGYTYDLNKRFCVPAFIAGGFTYYDFPANDLSSREFYIGGGLTTLLSPVFTWYHDFGDEDSGGGDGDYFALDISHSIPIKDLPVSLELGAHGGYNHELFIKGDGGDIGLKAGLKFQLYKNCSLTPSIGYSIPLADMKDPEDGNQDEEFYGGCTLAFAF